mmetsp:Transcript_692/g.2084  ORF Transcript_692/g.2084 Transcript_692/m.2084 type:complete len:201 (+) Transcript_692:168-770(+)
MACASCTSLVTTWASAGPLSSSSTCCASCMRWTSASTESRNTNRVIATGRCWPMRCTRATACWAIPASSAGSRRKTWLAATRVSPAPPARRERRKTRQPGSCMNVSSDLLSWVFRPVSSFTKPMSLAWRARPSNTSASENWLKTRLFSSGACLRRYSSRRSSASSFVSHCPVIVTSAASRRSSSLTIANCPPAAITTLVT